MPNILTTDDATFASSLGNWESTDVTLHDLTRQTSPTSPDGNNVARLEQLGGGQAVAARIPRDIYPIANGDLLSLDLNFMVPNTNTGVGRLFCQAQVIIYPAVAGGTSQGLATSAPFDPGDGWLHLNLPEFTVGPPGGSPAVSVGLQVAFSRWDIAPGVGVLLGDFAYFSDVYLGAAPVALGGWGVGMVRMGAN